MKKILLLCIILISCKSIQSQTYHCGTIEIQLDDVNITYGNEATSSFDSLSKTYEITYINVNGTYSHICLEPRGLVYVDKRSNMRFYLIVQDELTHDITMISVRNDDGKVISWNIKGLKEYDQLNASINE